MTFVLRLLLVWLLRRCVEEERDVKGSFSSPDWFNSSASSSVFSDWLDLKDSSASSSGSAWTGSSSALDFVVSTGVSSSSTISSSGWFLTFATSCCNLSTSDSLFLGCLNDSAGETVLIESSTEEESSLFVEIVELST